MEIKYTFASCKTWYKEKSQCKTLAGRTAVSFVYNNNNNNKAFIPNLQYHLCDKHKITGQCNPIRTKQQLKSILLELTQKHVLRKTFKQYPRSASQQAQSYQENKKNSCSSLLWHNLLPKHSEGPIWVYIYDLSPA
jgi:hypothetical protein